jgi:hypothetical protein
VQASNRDEPQILANLVHETPVASSPVETEMTVLAEIWQTAANGEFKSPGMMTKFNKNPFFTRRVSA